MNICLEKHPISQRKIKQKQPSQGVIIISQGAAIIQANEKLYLFTTFKAPGCQN